MIDESNMDDYRSKFNEAGLQIMRLNNSWQKCAYYAKRGMLTEWKWELETVWRELSPDARKKSRNDWVNNPYKLKVDALLKLIKNSEFNKNPTKMYYWLSNLEMYLRHLQDEVGKGSVYQDETEGML